MSKLRDEGVEVVPWTEEELLWLAAVLRHALKVGHNPPT
jgi:hypothetical protein